MSHTNEIEAFRMFHRRVSAVQLDECRIGDLRSTVHLARGATTETWTFGGPSAASRRYEGRRECECAAMGPDAA